MKNVSQNQESRKDFEAAKISDNKVCSTSINFDHFRFFSPISKRIPFWLYQMCLVLTQQL